MSFDWSISRTLVIGIASIVAIPPVALPDSVDLLTDGSGVRIDAAEPGDRTGRATTCDVNGDGLDDLVVGANEASGVNNSRPGAGEVSVIFGRRGSWRGPTGLEPLRGMWIIGEDPVDSLGYGVACGDVNGDGYADLVLGAPFADGVANARSGAGQIHIVFGSSTPPSYIDLLVEPSVTIVGGAEYAYISQTPAIGDLNGDGLDDLAIDSPLASDATATLDWAGRSYLVFGRTEWPQQIDLSRDSDVVIYGRRADDRLSAGQNIGDVTGDGTDDLVISVPNGDGPGLLKPQVGQLLIFRGRPLWPRTIDTTQEQPDSVVYGVDPHDQFGYYRHSIADLDGDGLKELVAASDVADGSHGVPLTGEIRAYQPGPQLKPTVDLRARTELYISGVDGGDFFYVSASDGDVNGDGRPDLVASAYGADGPDEQRASAGEIAVWYGRPIWPKTIDRAPGSEDLLIYGAETGDQFYPEAVGDLNGDGLDEIFGIAARGLSTHIESIWMLSPFDLDEDGVAQLPDNCPRLYNPEQADRDHDLIGDLCDNCPDLANVPQLDGDHDGLGDACDLCPDRPGGSSGDQDGDGIDGCVDNCVLNANPDQSDLDLDGTGDACDACPTDPLGDGDGDGICALLDNCPERFNPVQRDSDDDGAGDLCELCTLEGVNFAYSGVDDLLIRSAGDGSILLGWSESDGVDLYSVHRGRLSLLSAGSSGECVASDLKSPGWHDTASGVPSGDGWLYLVGTQNLSCAARSAGFDASERARADEFDACEQTDYHDAHAFSEETTLGTRAGNLGATWTPDGTVETLTEQTSPSPPSAPNLRTNLLVHQWWFTVFAGQRIEFHLDAQRDASQDWDTFRFEYSIDAGATWTELLLGRIPHTFRPLRRVIDVPSTTVGAVMVRVLDTDHTPGAVGLDSIQIDMMKFRTIRPTALP